MSELFFFVGLHQLADARHFNRSFISVNRLRRRKSDFLVNEWIMDSGAFTEISTHGHYRASEMEYAAQIDRWSRVGNFQAAAIQDYMCEPWIIQKTGLTVRDHQRLTIERYDRLRAITGARLLPVIQGYLPHEYVEHIEQYGGRLKHGEWVGVGSVCRRNRHPSQIEDILVAIKKKRPDLRLHGFGLKITALYSGTVRCLLHSSDSMAWCRSASYAGRNGNDWREAKAFEKKIDSLSISEALCQGQLF